MSGKTKLVYEPDKNIEEFELEPEDPEAFAC